ncbi:hypothetical protein RhiirA4_455492 [Rhizophagus irregularis]|uniref:Uncharacterized protein n=1 Tax=Rhizophagus irregularis TaxID=588596 RepID=A0A2I1G5B2_9GLOM|nr:hypothetical protein RhiirA4_455492 [Rhizophagus irregularis]
MAQLPQDYADNVETNNIQNKDDLVTEENDANTWTASDPMSLLPTEIYCGNSLDPATRSKIFQTEPRNRDISSTPLKNGNTGVICHVSPIDNALRIVYASKPSDETGESHENW